MSRSPARLALFQGFVITGQRKAGLTWLFFCTDPNLEAKLSYEEFHGIIHSCIIIQSGQ
jgi:hypothetical protein